jgi:hypothetical protein
MEPQLFMSLRDTINHEKLISPCQNAALGKTLRSRGHRKRLCALKNSKEKTGT